MTMQKKKVTQEKVEKNIALHGAGGGGATKARHFFTPALCPLLLISSIHFFPTESKWLQADPLK